MYTATPLVVVSSSPYQDHVIGLTVTALRVSQNTFIWIDPDSTDFIMCAIATTHPEDGGVVIRTTISPDTDGSNSCHERTIPTNSL